MTNNFLSLGVPHDLLASLERLQFQDPTPIQAQAIPPALEGRDVLGTAQTGTGKTAAFGIPLIAQLLQEPQGTALVMAPTRELAAQVMKNLHGLLPKKSNIKTALLIGGEHIVRQFHQLDRNPRIVVGTPGRINDHLERGSLRLDRARFLVLDETDRMLDMGFSEQIEGIIKSMSPTRQTLLFSATLPKNIMSLANRYLKDPVRITVGSTTNPAEKIKQEMVQISEKQKYDTLTAQLDQRDGSIIVFVKTKFGAQRLANRLRDGKYSADAIHGDLHQSKRDRVIGAFRDQKCRIMVATDVASRGLDIPHVRHVINYDLPQCPEDYIHRIGRTARAGAEGSALCLVTPEDRNKWDAINYLLHPELKPKAVRNNFKKRPFKGGFRRKQAVR